MYFLGSRNRIDSSLRNRRYAKLESTLMSLEVTLLIHIDYFPIQLLTAISGEFRCMCPPLGSDNSYYDVSVEKQNDVCRMACSLGTPLNGCPVCQQYKQHDNNRNDTNVVATRPSTSSSAEVTNSSDEEKLTSTTPDSSTSDNTTIMLPTSTTNTTDITTTTETPTTSATTTLRPPMTTPDWKGLCTNLCQIGEGGSLCNCDLPPFML